MLRRPWMSKTLRLVGKPGAVKHAVATLEGPEPAYDRGDHCSEPFDCPFDSYCRKQQPDPEWPVSLLPRAKKLSKRWADQGVLLLNATLTVEKSKAGAHQGLGWEQFTDAVIQKIADKK